LVGPESFLGEAGGGPPCLVIDLTSGNNSTGGLWGWLHPHLGLVPHGFVTLGVVGLEGESDSDVLEALEVGFSSAGCNVDSGLHLHVSLKLAVPTGVFSRDIVLSGHGVNGNKLGGDAWNIVEP